MCCFREEWQWLQALSSLEESVEMDHEVQSAPHRLLQDLRTAIKDLMAHINVPANQVRVSPKTDCVTLIVNRRLWRFTAIFFFFYHMPTRSLSKGIQPSSGGRRQQEFKTKIVVPMHVLTSSG